MQEESQGHQSSTGDYNALVYGTGNATVNVNLPPLTKRWLNPPPQILSKAFIGRQELVDSLVKEIVSGKQTTRALQGMGGIGKTYLALKLATELYDSFPGHTIRIDVGPAITDEASVQLPLSRLASYAFDGIAPPGPFQPEQVAAWLSETAPGPFLVIFDDLWYPTPLRILSRALPPNAVQLVTTRFANVAQAIGATIIPLDRLSPEDGLALLEDRLHCQPNSAFQKDLAALVHLLGGYALALEIAAAQIKKPSRLPTILHELEQGIGRGTLSGLKLSSGDERDENLERSFVLSYERMTPEQQRLFRAVGIFAEEAPITADAAASIWSIDDLNTAQLVLFELTDLALLTEIETATSNTTTFRLHNLLRVYARALLAQHNELTPLNRAHTQFFTVLSWQAMTNSPLQAEILDLHLPDLLSALDWSSHNDPPLFSGLLNPLGNFLLLRGQSVLLETYLPQALVVANQSRDRLRSANLLVSLGELESRLGNVEEARRQYDRALPLYREERVRLGEANVLVSLGELESRLGNVEEARRQYDRALPLYREERVRLGEANVLRSLGELESRLGNVEEARRQYEGALPLYREERDRLGEANVLWSLGDLESLQGNVEEARRQYEGALPLYREERNRLGEANVFRGLGDLESLQGNVEEAQRWYEEALPLYRVEHVRRGEANVYMRLGEMYTAQAMWAEARTSCEKAQPIYIVERDPLGLANTLIELGLARFELGDYEQGISDVQQAAILYRQVQDFAWAEQAEQRLIDLQARLQKHNS